jgi:hypothetical protein
MLISVVNHTGGEVDDGRLQTVLRAINRQIEEDFAPYWGMTATVRLEGALDSKPKAEEATSLRGDAVIYLVAESPKASDVLGFHDINNSGIPFGFVFLDIAKEVGENWSVTLSHEVLELIADPEANLLVAGPHPSDPKREVFHWYEVCDAVQDETYEIDGIAVSNFVLPLYFTKKDERGSRNDFLGAAKDRTRLRSFGVHPGGYIGFFDPETQDHGTFEADERASKRMTVKARAKLARRSNRYRQHGRVQPSEERALRPTAEPARHEGFALEVKPGAKADDVERRLVASIGRGWAIDPKAVLGHTWIVRPTAGSPPPGWAWFAARKLQNDLEAAGVVRAEPLFEVDLDATQDRVNEHAPRMRGRTTERAARAPDDFEWSPRQIKAFEAWQRLGGALPGDGIIVGHPDTGYRTHPEIWEGSGARILADRGYDFVHKDKNPLDDLEWGFMRFPGHGTSTASVIMSSRGQGTAPFVSGIAPGAKLIPYRVSRSVIHLSMTNLSMAIRAAVDEGCQVISISQGGPFSSHLLRQQLAYAEEKGVIVLAAAGNYVPFVVYPAKIPTVVAVAACNAKERPWMWSSHGSAVDVTAPGEDVYVASVDLAGSEAKNIVAPSSGTSYAVAATAGVAAMWLAHRKGALAGLSKSQIPGAFRHVLRSTARRPDGWDTNDFGSGIVDADAVLAAAVPAPGSFAAKASRSRRESIRDFVPGAAPREADRALREIFRIEDDDLDRALDDIGDELEFQLGTDPGLRKRMLSPADARDRLSILGSRAMRYKLHRR